MKRVLLPLSCAAAAGLAALATGSVASSSGAGAGGSVTVVEHATTDTTTDTGKKGDSVGDVLTFANAVYDAKDAQKVGTDQGYCVRVVKGASYECNWTLTLPAGQLVVEGPFSDTDDTTLAITGGTVAYAKARGSMSLHALDGGKKYRFAYKVR